MPTQVVVSRIQNRRGSYDDFISLYVPGAPDEQKLQPGELGLCIDTQQLFIGTDDVNAPFEIAKDVSPSEIVFTPIIIDLPKTSTWTTLSELSYSNPSSTPETIGLLNILYSLQLIGATGFAKNGTLSVTSLQDVAALTDTGVEINNLTGDITFKAIAELGSVHIQYTHSFDETVQMSTTTLKWIPL